jgi:hypothetical protein
MSEKPDEQLAGILARLALTQSQDEEEELGRAELSSWLFHASRESIDKLLKLANRDYRLMRCLSAARYYSGLSKAKCDQIDALLRAPFPAAARPKR